MTRALALPIAWMLVTAAVPAGPTPITPIAAPKPMRAMPMTIVGRVQRIRGADGAPVWRRQWPGTYFETAFRGTGIAFRVGAGEVALRVTVDGGQATVLVKPAPGFYAIANLAASTHRVRIAVASESQAAPSDFGGFYATADTAPVPLMPHARQIEFIGDSHTVGYGNTSTTQTCTEAQVWATTDTHRGIAGQAAARYGADYRVNAISGRGIVRNYAGGPGDTVPVAYPYTLFDKRERAVDPAWRPQVIAVALGTNDFSTPLKPGERWAARAALHADYETTYAAFVKRLRVANPRALIVLWATDLADGEIAAETRRVVDTLAMAGDRRIAFVPVHNLAFTACHGHPSVADDRLIAAAIDATIDARPNVWRR